MRRALLLFAAAPLALMAAGCDSDDPARVETQVVTIEVRAGGQATADVYTTWEMIVDNDGDNQPDDGQTYLWCEGPTSQNVPPVTLPWTFSTQIEIIPAGTTTKESVSSAEATAASFNVARYDIPANFRDAPSQNKAPVFEGTSTYRFSRPRYRSSVSELVFFATSNPLSQARGNPFGLTCGPGATTKTRCGLCAQTNNGPARIDGVVVAGNVECTLDEPDSCQMPWTITINSGDTITFEARLADSAPIGVGLREVVNSPPTSLSAILQVDGRSVPLQGTISGRALSFSYTSR